MHILPSSSMIIMMAMLLVTNAKLEISGSGVKVKFSVFSIRKSSIVLNVMQSELAEDESTNTFEDRVSLTSSATNKLRDNGLNLIPSLLIVVPPLSQC